MEVLSETTWAEKLSLVVGGAGPALVVNLKGDSKELWLVYPLVN